jgi:hypothetical protein
MLWHASQKEAAMEVRKRFDANEEAGSEPSPDSSRIFGTMADAGSGCYLRARDLPRLIALWPHELADQSPEGSLLILSKLRRALRAERRRALAGHWSYELNRHLGLMTAYKAELGLMRRAKLRLRRTVPAAARSTSAVRRRTRMQSSLLALASRLDRGGGRVVAEDPIDLHAILRKRQPQPEQHDMVAPWRRPAHHAVQRRTLLRHPGVDVVPIVSASTGEHPVDPLAGDLLTVNITEPRAGL